MWQLCPKPKLPVWGLSLPVLPCFCRLTFDAPNALARVGGRGIPYTFYKTQNYEKENLISVRSYRACTRWLASQITTCTGDTKAIECFSRKMKIWTRILKVFHVETLTHVMRVCDFHIPMLLEHILAISCAGAGWVCESRVFSCSTHSVFWINHHRFHEEKRCKTLHLGCIGYTNSLIF